MSLSEKDFEIQISHIFQLKNMYSEIKQRVTDKVAGFHRLWYGREGNQK